MAKKFFCENLPTGDARDGGYVVEAMADGRAVLFAWEPDDPEAQNPKSYTTYWTDVAGDAMADLNWVDDWQSVCNTTGIDLAELTEASTSSSACARALVYETVASTWGWHNIDNYPERRSLQEMRKRLPGLLKGMRSNARRRGPRAVRGPQTVEEMRRAGQPGQVPNARRSVTLARELKRSFPELSVEDAEAIAGQALAAEGNADAVEEVFRVFEEAIALEGNSATFGVEAIRGEKERDDYWANTVALYVNTGDTYSATLLYDRVREKFEVTTYGDFVEKYTRRYDIR